jgi:hypothetical protein
MRCFLLRIYRSVAVKNHLFVLVLATALLTCALPPAALAQSTGLSVAPTGYVQVGTQRIDRYNFSYTYTAVLNNTGGALPGVTATLTSLAANVTVVPGQGTLEFSPVPAGAVSAPSQVTSANTFTIVVNRELPFDFSSLSWSFNNPYANPGPNQTVPNLSLVTLNGSGSTNPSGIGSLTYTWAFQSVPTGSNAVLSNANSSTATFVPDLIGTYVVSLTVSNGSQSDTNTVTISTTDVPPVANPGPNQTVTVGAIVMLDGTKSTDVNGQPLSYLWSLVTTPNGSAAVISSPRSPTPSFTADVAGTYIVGLVVNDGTLSSAKSTVTITTGNTPPVAVPTATPQVVAVNGLVQLSGVNSTDVDSNPLTFQWTLNTSEAPGSKATLSNGTIVNPTFTADVPGTYVAQLIVFDGTIASKPVTVMITTSAIVAPTANAGTNQMVGVGTTVQLQGSGTDPQSLPLTYSWSLTTIPMGSAAVLSKTNIQNPTFIVDLPGTYAAQLIVSNGYLSSPAATVTITSTSTPPIAVPTTTTPSLLIGATAELSGASSTDPNGVPITGYSWSLSIPGGSRARLTGANTEFATFVPDVAGTYVAQLIVSDQFGSSNPATVSVTAGQMTIALTPNPLNLTNSPQALTITISPGTGLNPLPVTLSGYDPTVISLPSNTVTIPANSTAVNVSVTPVAAGNTNIAANADGYQPASVPVNVTTPTLSIAFNNNVTVVGLNHTVGGTITLSSPAPQNGANVTLVSINDTDAGQMPGAVTFNPTLLTIPAGQTTGTFTVTGTALGNVGILPGSAGYARVNFVPFSVVILGNVTIPATTPAPVGQSVALNVQLSSPAPADGATITLQSSNTGVATVPASVTIAPGATTPSVAPQVTGVGLGSATITASSSGYNGGSGTVNVNATLSFSPATTLSLAPNTSQTIAVNLSGPAPPAGLIVNLSSDNPSAATVPASVTISGGLETASVQVGGGATGTAHITASTSNPFVSAAGATLTVTITNAPVISCPTTTSAEVGFPFSSGPLTVTGGTSPFTFSVATGSLSGLTLNSSTGAISGTPMAAGSFTIKVTDATGATATSCTFTINNALALPCPSLTTGEVNAAFSSQLTATGGVTPYTYAVVGTLPAGLTLSGTGLVSGTPTAAGTFTIKVTDANGATATSCTFTINNALALPCPSVTTGEVNAAFSSQLTATGGVTPYTYAVVGTLPAGLTLSGTGLVSGTPTAAGTFTIKVTDANGATASSCTFTINNSLALPCPSVTTGEVNAAFSSQLTATGGVTPYTYAVVGTLPAGLTLSGTGLVSGTPTAAGTFTIKVTDANGATATSCTFTINNALALPCPSVTTGVVGTAFSSQLTATGGVTPYTYAVVGTLPAGLTLSGTGLVSGTPTAAGTFTIKVMDAGGATATSCMFTMSIGLTLPCPSITTGEVNVTFSSQLSAAGGAPPYTYALASGSLLGLTLSSTGLVSGTPTAAGTFTIKVTDSSGATATSCTFTINNALALPCPSVTTGVAGTAFSSQLTATGGVTPYTYAVVGTLPAGLTLSGTGLVSGTPTAAGTFTIKVTDANGATATSCMFTISGALTLPCPSITTGEVNAAFSSQLSAAGGVAPYTYSLASGSLLGLTLSSTGLVSGTPTAAGTFTIKVMDSTGATATSCTFTINNALALPCPSVTTAEVGTAFSSQLSPTGGVAPFTYSVGTGSLSGLMLSGTGLVSGTPTASGSFTIKVMDATGATATSCTFTINAALLLPCPTVTTGEVNVPFSTQLSASGGIAPYTYSMSGTVPSGLTLSSSGLVSGTPTVTGRFFVTVTDAAGATATSCSITINGPLSLPCPSTTAGDVGAAFSSQLAATGGVTPYSYAVVGTLPAGLTLSGAGLVSGTPTAAGTFTIKVTDATGATSTSCTFTISNVLTLPCPTTTTGEVGVSFSSQLSAAGGAAPYTYAVVGTLPAGLTLSGTGLVSGTPTAAGTFTIKVTDGNGVSATSCTFTILSHVAMTCPATLTGAVGNPFSATPTVSGGLTPYAFSLSLGTLPNGLTLSATTGAITGTPTVAGGFTLQVTDAEAALAATTCAFNINPPSLHITTTSLPGVVQNAAYSATVMAAGGTAPYTWTAGTPFPTWLSINSSTGVISGTANRGAGTFPLQVVVSDNSNPQQVATSVNLSVVVTPLTFAFVNTSPLPSATVGMQYVEPIAVQGGTPPYNYSVLQTSLPSWLTFDVTGAACGTTGPTLCGIPPSIQVDNIAITASDSGGNQLNTTFALSVVNVGGDTISVSADGGSNSSFVVGQGLQVPMTIAFNPALTSPLTLTITPSTSGLVTFSETQTSTVSNTYTVTVPAGTPAFSVYVQGVASSGTTTLTVSAPPYTAGTGTVTLANSGFVLSGPGGVGGPFSSFEGVTTGLTVLAARLDSNGLFAENQQVASNPSCQTVNMQQVCTQITTSVPLTVSPSTLGTLSANPLTFSGGVSSVALNFKASTVSTGTGTVSITSQPSGFTTPTTGTSVGFTITPSGFTLPTLTVGNDLQVQTAITVNGSSASASTITLQSLNPAQLQFYNTETGTGKGETGTASGSVTLTIPAGATQSSNFWVRGYGAPGTVGYTITSSAFGNTSGSVTIGQSGLVIATPGGPDANFSLSPGSSFADLTIETALVNSSGSPLQLQEVAADQSISVTVTSSNLSTGTISSSPITIAGATTGATTTFSPLSTGTSTITAAGSNGFLPSNDPALSASVKATVTTCTLSVNNGVTVGQFLEAEAEVITACPAGINGTPVTLTSNSPFVQLAVNPTDPGSNSITVTVPAGQHVATYWVYGLGTGLTSGEGASPQTVTYTASTTSNGSGTDTVTLAPSAILVSGPNDAFGSFSVSASSGGAQAMTVVTDVLTNDGNNTPTNDGFGQPLAGNAGNNPLLVTLANSNSSAGSLAPLTVSIAPGNFMGTATFTPTSPGNTTISVTQPAAWIGNVGTYPSGVGPLNLTQVLITVTQ